MKSPVKPRLIRIFLDGEPHREIDLATGAGFTKIATIQKWIDSFQNAGFIERYRSPDGPEYLCRLVTGRESVLKIYNQPEFRALRPEIRQAPWFCRVFTGNFSTLQDPLPKLIDRMVVQSHTFFEILHAYDSPGKIRETFGTLLLLNQLAGIIDPVFNDEFLYYQIFVQAVIRDIAQGGLGSGFALLLDECRQDLTERYGYLARPARNRKGHSYEKREKRLV